MVILIHQSLRRGVESGTRDANISTSLFLLELVLCPSSFVCPLLLCQPISSFGIVCCLLVYVFDVYISMF